MNDFKNMLVREVMARNPICVSHDTLLNEVRDIFSKHAIHHIPVVDDSKMLVGIISWTDMNLIFEWSTKFNIDSGKTSNEKLLKSMTAIDICTKDIFTVRALDSVLKCFELFKMNKFKGLPVVNEEGHVIGIITTLDLLSIAYEDQGGINIRI